MDDAPGSPLAPDAPRSEEAEDSAAALIADLLGVDAHAVSLFSREPLGRGEVSGFVTSVDSAEIPAGTVAYLDTSGLAVARETGWAEDDGGRVWVHPADPHLPALAPAAFGGAAEVLLTRLGIAAAAPPRIIGYRPGRRAVLRVETSGGAAWVKVVRPRRIERVVRAHVELRDAGLPVPTVRGWSPEGLLVLDTAVGVPATEARADPDRFLDRVDDLRARLAAAPSSAPARTSLADRLPWYLASLRDVESRGDLERRGSTSNSATDADEMRELGREIAAALQTPPAEARTIHGDLHLGQLFVDGDDGITGLIDVDTAGHGDPADDAAAFVGHAVATTLLTERQGGEADRIAELAAAAADRWLAGRRARGLTAVHLLGHALGAASAADPERARALLTTAADIIATGRADFKSPLIATFEAP